MPPVLLQRGRPRRSSCGSASAAAFYVDVPQSIDAAGSLWLRFAEANVVVRFSE